jgi:osmotically-inducible protein OsmY
MSNPGSTGSTSSTESGSTLGSSAMSDHGATAADQSLNQNLRQALSSDPSLGSSARTVHFSSDNGKVILHGTVATEKEKKDIEAKVAKMTGVKNVDNQLQIAPAASSAAQNMGAGSTRTGSTSSRTTESTGSSASR